MPDDHVNLTTLAEIDALARAYADQRKSLSDAVSRLQRLIDAARKELLPEITAAAGAAANAQGELAAAIGEAKYLFRRPRTVVLHGIKCGFEKGKGTVAFSDAERVVKLIRKHFPAQFEALVRVKETPVKTALAALPAADLKRLGVELRESGDHVVTRPTDSEIDKLVAALLKAGSTDAGDDEGDEA